jgi:hypothetical protein
MSKTAKLIEALNCAEECLSTTSEELIEKGELDLVKGINETLIIIYQALDNYAENACQNCEHNK